VKRRFIKALLGGLLSLGAFVVPTSTASAHNYDGYAIIYCTAHPPPFGGALKHAWPYSLAPGILYYVCTWDFFGETSQGFVGRNMSTGAHWQQGGWQDCDWIGCEPHGPLFEA
jgi:hypothetical protein